MQVFILIGQSSKTSEAVLPRASVSLFTLTLIILERKHNGQQAQSRDRKVDLQLTGHLTFNDNPDVIYSCLFRFIVSYPFYFRMFVLAREM